MKNREKLLTVFSLFVLVMAVCSCEQIRNGDFATGSLSPGWTACTDHIYGGVTDVNQCGFTTYNLSLRENDCFQQDLSHAVTATGPFTFWSAGPHLGVHRGKFYARVYYSDGTSDTIEIPYTVNCDTKHMVNVDYSKQVSRVRLYTVDSDGLWYVSGVSLPGY